MKIASIVAVVVVAALLGIQAYMLLARQRELRYEFDGLNKKLQEARLDELGLQDKIKYLSDPANYEKELRARFNYRAPGEKLIIIVPKNQTSSVRNDNQDVP